MSPDLGYCWTGLYHGSDAVGKVPLSSLSSSQCAHPAQSTHEGGHKSLVLLSPYVTHRHPDYWDEPEVFNPERFTPERAATRHRYAYFPFGGGPHLCIGNHFAMMEAQLILAAVAQRYRSPGA